MITVGMDGFMANVLPHQKQEKIKEYQTAGEIVAMTGESVNDAPALAQAYYLCLLRYAAT